MAFGPTNRRGFIMTAGAYAAGLLLLPARAWAKAKGLAVKLDKAEALKTVGGSVTLKLKGKEILFIRDADTSIRAVNPTCTHKQCTVAYVKAKNRIECPCHASAFDLDGTVTSGPAPRPLETYPAKLQLEKNRLIVTVEE